MKNALALLSTVTWLWAAAAAAQSQPLALPPPPGMQVQPSSNTPPPLPPGYCVQDSQCAAGERCVERRCQVQAATLPPPPPPGYNQGYGNGYPPPGNGYAPPAQTYPPPQSAYPPPQQDSAYPPPAPASAQPQQAWPTTPPPSAAPPPPLPASASSTSNLPPPPAAVPATATYSTTAPQAPGSTFDVITTDQVQEVKDAEARWYKPREEDLGLKWNSHDPWKGPSRQFSLELGTLGGSGTRVSDSSSPPKASISEGLFLIRFTSSLETGNQFSIGIGRYGADISGTEFQDFGGTQIQGSNIKRTVSGFALEAGMGFGSMVLYDLKDPDVQIGVVWPHPNVMLSLLSLEGPAESSGVAFRGSLPLINGRVTILDIAEVDLSLLEPSYEIVYAEARETVSSAGIKASYTGFNWLGFRLSAGVTF